MNVAASTEVQRLGVGIVDLADLARFSRGECGSGYVRRECSSEFGGGGLAI